MNPSAPGWRGRLLAEFLGTAVLLCTVIGSGIMAERLSGGNSGLALLANTMATVFMLFVLIETLGPVSGAHFNPVVTVIMWTKNNFVHIGNHYLAIFYIASQLLGAVTGAWLAHAMFDEPLLQTSQTLRGGWDSSGQFAGWGQWIAEAVATAGLLLVILRSPVDKAAARVACYVGAAYWFTASTSFANPAAVLGRMLSDSFAGIAPASALGFVAAQFVGGAIGLLVANRLDD